MLTDEPFFSDWPNTEERRMREELIFWRMVGTGEFISRSGLIKASLFLFFSQIQVEIEETKRRSNCKKGKLTDVKCSSFYFFSFTVHPFYIFLDLLTDWNKPKISVVVKTNMVIKNYKDSVFYF